VAASIKLAGSCGKRRLVRGVAAESEVGIAIVGWAVWSLRVASDCMVKASPVKAEPEAAISSPDECIVVVVGCGSEVMAVVAR